MHIHVTITYAPDDQPTMSTSEIADAMFAAMGADEDKDTCYVQVNQTGSIGAQTPPPTPPG